MARCYVPKCDETCEEAGEKNRLIFRAPNSAVHKWIKYLPKGPVPFNPRVVSVPLHIFLLLLTYQWSLSTLTSVHFLHVD